MTMLEGLNPGSYTPFTADNRLDEKALSRELQLVTKGAGSLHGPAGHSEFASLTFDEWKVWVDVLVDVAHKANIKAWSFLGGESFEKTIPQVEYALKAGADGLLVIATALLQSLFAGRGLSPIFDKAISRLSIPIRRSPSTRHIKPATTSRPRPSRRSPNCPTSSE